MNRIVRSLSLGALGVAAACPLAEVALRFADDGAFPHLNVYEADPTLGVRLRPRAVERVAFGGNPTTDVRINLTGFRGADWPGPQDDEIVVVGDSQVFGLGVNEADSFPARLGVATGRPVINAGVPTYGPAEYLAVIDQLLTERHPRTVVAVVNFSNDLFERDRPNRERHKVWDGWAVRAETMPDDVVDFPGRTWLFRESHLVFSLRRAAYTPIDPADVGLPSEGGVEDLLPAAAPTAVDAPAPSDPRLAAVAAANAKFYAHNNLLYLLTEVDDAWKYEDLVAAQAVVENTHPGDIVFEREAEGSRAVTVTAELLQRGAKMRREAVPTLRAWLAAHPDPKTEDAAELCESVRRELAAWDEQVAALAVLATTPERPAAAPSALHDWIVETAAHVDAAGAELVLVALPLDVQVSADEWAKYGKPPLDMADSQVLLDDLVAEARVRGVRGVNLIDALRAAEPGAFLAADLHMSPKGTDAAAKAVAAALATPAPTVQPGPGYPPGRSRMPTWDEMLLADEIRVPGSSRNRCSTRRSREWFVLDCADAGALGGGRGEAPELRIRAAPLERAWFRSGTRTSVLLPLIPGYDATIDLKWAASGVTGAGVEPTLDPESPWREGRRERLTVRWTAEEPTIRFEPASEAFAPEPREPAAAPCLGRGRSEFAWANEARGCSTSFTDCDSLRACATGLGPSPTCAESTAAVGSPGWCYALCDAATPCAEGRCTAWEGGHICL